MSLVNENGNEEDEEGKLINQIEHEMKKIHLSVEKLYNNLSLSETNDPVEKCLINNYSYSSCLLEKGINDTYDSDEAMKMFERSLQQELEFLTSDLDRMLTKMNDYNEIMSRLDKNIENLHAMVETGKKNEQNSSKNMNEISKNIKMRFRKEKSELKTIISSLFSDNLDIQDIIANVIEHHFNVGSDKYLQLENGDNILEYIELLRRTTLFQTNPHDVLQIKLADLI